MILTVLNSETYIVFVANDTIYFAAQDIYVFSRLPVEDSWQETSVLHFTW